MLQKSVAPSASRVEQEPPCFAADAARARLQRQSSIHLHRCPKICKLMYYKVTTNNCGTNMELKKYKYRRKRVNFAWIKSLKGVANVLPKYDKLLLRTPG